MYRVAVIGDRESVYGFSAVGLEVYMINTPDDAAVIFETLVKKDYAVIYVTEHLAEFLEAEIAKLAFATFPSIILIPGVLGNTGKGKQNLKNIVEKAVGSFI